MAEQFDLIEYGSYLLSRWRFAAVSIALALALTATVCRQLPRRYTATATLVIEPPAGSDLRSSTAVSAVYLESLRTYEEVASSNSLFAKACDKFHLLDDRTPIEILKRRVLRVTKPKDTKVLQISVTLPDAPRAQALVQYLAEGTLNLSRDLAKTGESDNRSETNRQIEKTRALVEQAQAEQASVEASGSIFSLEEDIRANAGLRAKTSEQLFSSSTQLAEAAAQPDAQLARAEAAPLRARIAFLTSERKALEQEGEAKAVQLATLRSRATRADDRLQEARATLDALTQRLNDVEASSGTRSEQLRIIDPGIVPQQPSFPQPALFLASAALVSAMFVLVYLTFAFGWSRQRAQNPGTGWKVARGGAR